MTAAASGVLPDPAGHASYDGRWELLRALGAVVLTPPPGNAGLCEALDLPVVTGAEHTAVFVLGAVPHASIHLGAEGMLGGDGLDRVAGFWRALGMKPTEDADHLGALLMLYAELGQVETGLTDPRRRHQVHRARTALLHEHLWSWAPGYLRAVADMPSAWARAWAALAAHALETERATEQAPADLPLALREAPPAITAETGRDDLLDAMVAPVRSGLVLTQRDLAALADEIGVGFRRGERRFALKAMLEQDAPATLRALARTAAEQGAAYDETDPVQRWWKRRATESSQALVSMEGTR